MACPILYCKSDLSLFRVPVGLHPELGASPLAAGQMIPDLTARLGRGVWNDY
jgi:hypothetical protein